jgi:nuclear pore complex protein Nup160
MVEHGQSVRLCSFPFTGLQDLVDQTLLQKCEDVVDVRPSPSYHKILFSWRIKHGDFQGGISSLVISLTIAAAVMYQRLQLLRNATSSEMDVDLETLEISEAYLAIINALSCVAARNAWIFVSKIDDVESPAVKRIKMDDRGRRYWGKAKISDKDENCIIIGGSEEGIRCRT